MSWGTSLVAVGSWVNAVGSSAIGEPDGVIVGRGAVGVSLPAGLDGGGGDVEPVLPVVVDMLELLGLVEVMTSSGVVLAVSLLVLKSPKDVLVGVASVVDSEMVMESALVTPAVCVAVTLT